MNKLLRQSGFTVIEMVSVIVLLGILSAGVVHFIGDSTRIYVDNSRRSELTQQGRYAVERINREVRNALPGSVRASNNGATFCLEFMPVVAASSYINPVAGMPTQYVEVITHPDLVAGGFNGSLAAIYAIDNNSVYGVASTSMAEINTISDENPAYPDDVAGDNLLTIALDAPNNFPLDSPQQRVYIVNERVSYCAVDGLLTRYSAYGSAGAAQPLPPNTAGFGGVEFTIAEHIRVADSGVVTVFEYTPGVLARTGVVHLDMRFRDDEASAEWVRFSHEVFVRNAQ